MFLFSFINFIISAQFYADSSYGETFLEYNESICEYDKNYNKNSIYYFPFCIVRCIFNSITTNTNGVLYLLEY